MTKNSIEQTKRIRLGIKLTVSVAIVATAILLSPTTTQAFTLIEEPASSIDVYSPVSVSPGQILRLNAANVFCDGSVRVLFKFFSGDGVTLQEEIKSVACGQMASSALPYIERGEVGGPRVTDGAGPHVYGIVALLPAVQRLGNTRKGLCPSDPSSESAGPLVTSLEIVDRVSVGDVNGDGSVRQTLLPAVKRTCGTPHV